MDGRRVVNLERKHLDYCHGWLMTASGVKDVTRYEIEAVEAIQARTVVPRR
jgi:hypothetical protein